MNQESKTTTNSTLRNRIGALLAVLTFAVAGAAWAGCGNSDSDDSSVAESAESAGESDAKSGEEEGESAAKEGEEEGESAAKEGEDIGKSYEDKYE